MSVQAVVFDMDGLMLDTEPLYKAAWQRACLELGYQFDDAHYARIIGRPTADGELELVQTFGSAFPLDAFRARWPHLWQTEADAGGIAVKTGLLELLTFVEQQRLRIAVATSTEAAFAEFSLRKAGLEGRFAVIVTGDQIQRGKPAPDIYLEAARRLNTEPSQCIALEDSEAGIRSASAAGMIALMIPDLTRPSAVAREAAFRVVPSLIEARDIVAALIAGGAGA
jgi:beta-phosphoglucomutase-like phosphatase (HAD superfamily)